MDSPLCSFANRPSWKPSLHLGWLLLFLLSSALLVSSGQARTGRPQSKTGVLAEELSWSGGDFSDGQSKGPLSKDPAGLVLTLPSTGVYTSPAILAPIPFSDLGCSWEADLPDGAALRLELRSSPDREGDRWSSWVLIEEDPELPPMAWNQYAGELFFVPQQDGVHQRFQYRLSFSSLPTESSPMLRRLSCTLIDARAGPSTSEILDQKGRSEVSGLEQPPLISRGEWGCPEGQESPRWPPEYERVTHVIVHHTATPNDDVNWAARVRAIWYYHANTRGWGDIGYNYVIDPLGNVYEGRAGGEDVVGGHARSYNPGTMGVGCLGTYTSAPVPAPLQETLEALIAWKASQRGIDPLGRSFNNHKVYAHISGHRDVGQTTCPGNVLYALLPAIRQNVLTRLLQQEDTIVVDEQGPDFDKSAAYWHEGCAGYAEHCWWTHTVTNPTLSTNWGIWRPTLPVGGWYEVFAYIPSCSGTDLPEYTETARYRVYYRGGGSIVIINQKVEQGRWVSLGTYPFYGGTTGHVYLDDIADDHWRSLWYDAVRWVLRGTSADPPPALLLQAPIDGSWIGERQVLLSWQIPPTATLYGLNLAVSTRPDLGAPLLDTNLPIVDQYLLNLAGDYPALYWSVRGQNANGYGPFAPVRRFGVDTLPPTSSIVGLYQSQTGTYYLMWQGQDSGNGVACYTVQVRDGPTGSWRDLWVDVPWTSSVVEIPPEGIRYFRVHARDLLGHQETPHEGDGDISSEDITFLSWGWYQPLVIKNWTGPTRQPNTPRPTTSLPAPSPTSTAPVKPPPTPGATGNAPLTVLPSETPAPPPMSTRVSSPTPDGRQGQAQSRPDLQVVRIYSSQDSPFDCGRPSGIAVEICNAGSVASGPFDLELTGEGIAGCRWHLEDLPSGMHIEQICPQIVLNTVIHTVVDVGNTVEESAEDNNRRSETINVLVLPTCTPRPDH